MFLEAESHHSVLEDVDGEVARVRGRGGTDEPKESLPDEGKLPSVDDQETEGLGTLGQERICGEEAHMTLCRVGSGAGAGGGRGAFVGAVASNGGEVHGLGHRSASPGLRDERLGRAVESVGSPLVEFGRIVATSRLERSEHGGNVRNRGAAAGSGGAARRGSPRRGVRRAGAPTAATRGKGSQGALGLLSSVTGRLELAG